MKKKFLIGLLCTAFVAGCVFIPPMQTFAVSALSVFRVGSPKTIKVTLEDIEYMMSYAEEFKNENEDSIYHAMGTEYYGDYDHENMGTVIENVEDFTAFKFNLPKDLKNETPEIMAISSTEKTFSLNDEKIVKLLGEKINEIPAEFLDAQITINTPAAIVAEYDDTTLFATQNIYIDAPRELKEIMWNQLISKPFVSANIYDQLKNIDVETKDIYLPVIMGLGREVNVGNKPGVVYTSQDFLGFASKLVENADMSAGYGEDENYSVLIWTNDDVIYVLASDRTDAELIEIARSIH